MNHIMMNIKFVKINIERSITFQADILLWIGFSASEVIFAIFFQPELSMAFRKIVYLCSLEVVVFNFV